MASPNIDAILFDIGWVFLRLNYRPILEFLAAHGAPTHDPAAVLERIALSEHESGRLHGQELLERPAALTSAPVTLSDVRAKWLDMFEIDAPMVDLAHRLSERYGVYLLSNIGDLHWAHPSREYRLHTIGHGALPSYLAGVMKPHARIYAEAERRFGLNRWPRSSSMIAPIISPPHGRAAGTGSCTRTSAARGARCGNLRWIARRGAGVLS